MVSQKNKSIDGGRNYSVGFDLPIAEAYVDVDDDQQCASGTGMIEDQNSVHMSQKTLQTFNQLQYSANNHTFYGGVNNQAKMQSSFYSHNQSNTEMPQIQTKAKQVQPKSRNKDNLPRMVSRTLINQHKGNSVDNLKSKPKFYQ